MNLSVVSESCERILNQVRRAIVGKDEVLKRALMGILSAGHILIEDVPGLAKTLLARSFAQALDIGFSRIQFTPDLLPGDITGANIYDQRENRFTFSAGPIFSNLILADEINRASPKTQSALLEAMQEGQVTIEGERHVLSLPFFVMATQNPIEFEGTYPLPEAQLDRFIMKLSIGYPSEENEREIIRRRQERRQDAVEIDKAVSLHELLEMQQALEDVHLSEEIGRYIVSLVRHTREDSRAQVGASPRGTLALFKLSRSAALVAGRDFVTPEDVKEVAVIGLSHRIILKPEIWVRGVREEQIIREILDQVPVPQPVEER